MSRGLLQTARTELLCRWSSLAARSSIKQHSFRYDQQTVAAYCGRLQQCRRVHAPSSHRRCALNLDRSSAGQEQATEEDAWCNDQPAERRSDGASTSGRHADDFELLDLPAPTNVRVKKAAYVKSSVTLAQCPKPKLPEFAVIGRSNVGKSSLINMLTGQDALAKVSKTPGKTVCINHFIINDTWYLVDLPGYGYAQRSKESRLEWSAFTKEYFLKRETLANVLLLVDSSVPVQAADLECAGWLADAQVPFSLVFTKTDKRKKRCPSPRDNMKAFQAELQKAFENLPPMFETDAETLRGQPELLAHIAQLRAAYDED